MKPARPRTLGPPSQTQAGPAQDPWPPSQTQAGPAQDPWPPSQNQAGPAHDPLTNPRRLIGSSIGNTIGNTIGNSNKHMYIQKSKNT